MIRIHSRTLFWTGITLLLFLASIFTIASQAQDLGYEGPTGVFVTPLASVAPSESNGFGHPVVAYHFLNGGDVIGNYSTISVTEGAFQRIEFGYTAELQKQGDDHTNSVNLAPLWSEAMHIVHGKANLIPENAFHTRWVPAISAGAIGRFHDNNVGDGTNSAVLHNALSITNGVQTSKNADSGDVKGLLFMGPL